MSTDTESLDAIGRTDPWTESLRMEIEQLKLSNQNLRNDRASLQTRLDHWIREHGARQGELDGARKEVDRLTAELAAMQAEEVWTVSDLRGPIISALEQACVEHDGVVEWPDKLTVKVDTLPGLCDLECVSPTYGLPGCLSAEIVGLIVRVAR
ncbi:MAG: hypothetical protein KGL39_34530 [Patescibacteria group bacterium]|nr:hypothetical protein [Patescibacteria group bacterium]